MDSKFTLSSENMKPPGSGQPDGEAQKSVVIDDTTLRDGEQSAGIAFNADEKIRIAQGLIQAGVSELEVGIPAMGREEQEVIRAIADLKLGGRLLAWCRMTTQDLDAAQSTGVDMVDLSIPVSDQQMSSKLGLDRKQVLERIRNVVPLALDLGFEVCVGCEDASRADQEFLSRVVETVSTAGARRLRYADTVGVMEPFGVAQVFSRLRAACDLELEMHAHDDFGLATANTLAAVYGGATHINTTVNGLGERAGNAPLEELVVALKHLYGIETGVDTQQLMSLSRLVQLASGRSVGWHKSVVGEGVFTHEAGIHVDGLLKDPMNYQGLDPAELGRSHNLILGKHSGSSMLRHCYLQMGITLAKTEAEPLLDEVRNFVSQYKREPGNDELLHLYREFKGGFQGYDGEYKLEPIETTLGGQYPC